MASANGKRISDLERASEIPNGTDFVVELPNNAGTRKVSQRLINETVYNNLLTGEDTDVDDIIAGKYKDPDKDDWGEDTD